MSEVKKRGFRMTLSDEWLWLLSPDPRYKRKILRVIDHDPTEEDWTEYNRGSDLLEELRDNRFFDEGGPDYGNTMREPTTTSEIIYAETHEEWVARCQELDRE